MYTLSDHVSYILLSFMLNEIKIVLSLSFKGGRINSLKEISVFILYKCYGWYCIIWVHIRYLIWWRISTFISYIHYNSVINYSHMQLSWVEKIYLSSVRYQKNHYKLLGLCVPLMCSWASCFINMVALLRESSDTWNIKA